MGEKRKDVMSCLNYLMDAMMMGVQKENVELMDDQMVDVSFYVLPL
jgi:cytochrome c